MDGISNSQVFSERYLSGWKGMSEKLTSHEFIQEMAVEILFKMSYFALSARFLGGRKFMWIVPIPKDSPLNLAFHWGLVPVLVHLPQKIIFQSPDEVKKRVHKSGHLTEEDVDQISEECGKIQAVGLCIDVFNELVGTSKRLAPKLFPNYPVSEEWSGWNSWVYPAIQSVLELGIKYAVSCNSGQKNEEVNKVKDYLKRSELNKKKQQIWLYVRISTILVAVGVFGAPKFLGKIR